MRGLLLDLDDTLYDYPPCEAAARAAVTETIARDLGIPLADADARWVEARRLVFERLGPRAAAHSRLIALSELVHRARRPDALAHLRRWERHYWNAYLARARLRANADRLLLGWRARGGRTAIVTDLTLEVQLMKLERFKLLPSIDALVTSEEVLLDKPDPAGTLLAIERLGLPRDACILMGDRAEKEGEVARALGLPFVWVDPAVPDLAPAIAALEALVTRDPTR